MKLLLSIFFVLCVGSQLVFAQNIDVENKRFVSSLFQLDEYIKRQDKFVDYADTESYLGTPYNNPEYLLGNVYKNNKLLARGVALRYNAIADEIEIKETLETSIKEARPLPKSPDVFVKIKETIFVFAPYRGGIEDGGYFQVLYEGEKIDVFKKLNKKFIPAKPAKTSITRGTKAKFVDKPVYYLVTKAGRFYELPSSRKRKLDVFGKHKESLRQYVEKNRLDLNEEQDLIMAVLYFNSLNNIKL